MNPLTTPFPDSDEMAPRRRMLPVLPLLVKQSLREILIVFILVLSVSTALMMLVGVGMHLMEHGIGGPLLLRLLPYIVPSMLPFTIPASLLLAVILVYARMSADLELTAVKAAGINVLSLLIIPFTLAGLLSGATFVLTDQVAPWAASRMEFVMIAHIEEMLLHQLNTSHQATYPPANLRMTVAAMDGEWMIRPLIRYQTEDREHTLVASAARVEIDPGRQMTTLHLRDATVEFGESDRMHLNGDQSIPLHSPASPTHLPTHFISLAKIRRRIEDARLTIVKNQRRMKASESQSDQEVCFWEIHYAQKELNYLRTELHGRYALACSCLCFALFGCPLAAVQARGSLVASLLRCFLPIVGAYYTLVLGIAVQCRQGLLNPAWAMWTGNVMLLGLAAWGLYRLTSR